MECRFKVNFTHVFSYNISTGDWVVGGYCKEICLEEDAPLDLSTMTVTWDRQTMLLMGAITCKDGYSFVGKFATFYYNY